MSACYGLIGLGNVGKDLARDAVAAGLRVLAYDVNAAALERAAGAGVESRSSAAAVAAEAEILVLSLPNSQIVDAVLADGVFESLRPGSVLVDMSTNLPARAIALVEECSARGVRVIDAPVTYGPTGLIAYAGGEAADVAIAAPWLDAAVSQWFHVGPHGHGQYVKLVQNILSGVGMGVLAEAIGFSLAAGIDLDTLHDALRPSGAYSGLIERVMPMMQERRYSSNGTMALHSKDMGYALQTAHELGIQLPFTAALREVFEDILKEGDRRWSQIALIEWWSPLQQPDIG